MKLLLQTFLFFISISIYSQNNSANLKNYDFPEPIGYVNDYGNVFSEMEINTLNEKITKYKSETSNEIVIITINDIGPYENIQMYATEIGNKWGVGLKEKDNGLIIAFCKPCRNISLATGYGTELILKDEICYQIIQETIIPEFKNGEFYLGINNALNEIIKIWNGN